VSAYRVFRLSIASLAFFPTPPLAIVVEQYNAFPSKTRPDRQPEPQASRIEILPPQSQFV